MIPALPPTDDLRYITFANQQLCFDPGPSTQFEETDWRTYLNVLNDATDGTTSGLADFDKVMRAYSDGEIGETESGGGPLLDDEAVDAVVGRIISTKESEGKEYAGKGGGEAEAAPFDPQVSERYAKKASFAEGFLPYEEPVTDLDGEGTVVDNRPPEKIFEELERDEFDWDTVSSCGG